MDSFAKNLKQAREKSGMTQEQLGIKLNVTRQTVSCWERGRTEPDLATLSALSDILNTTPDGLLTGREHSAYPRFQRKYLAWISLALTLALLIFLLDGFAKPYIARQVNMSHNGKDMELIIFRLALPFLGGAGLGVAGVSFAALFHSVRLGNRRRAACILGAVLALPSLLTILDWVLLGWLPTYRLPFANLFFVWTVPYPLIQGLLFFFLPCVSGSLLFLGAHRESGD